MAQQTGRDNEREREIATHTQREDDSKATANGRMALACHILFIANGSMAPPCHILLTVQVIKIFAFRSIAGQVRTIIG